MRILHVINDLSIGGAEKLVSELVPIINRKNDIKAEVLLIGNDTTLKENLVNNEVKFYCLKSKNLYNPLNILKLRSFLRKYNFDIVHTHLFPANYWVSIVSLTILKNRPIFITTEHNTFNKRRKIKFFKYIETTIYRNYDAIISISEATQKSLINWIGKIKNTTFKVILNGISLEKFSSREKYSKKYFNKFLVVDNVITNESKLLCMVGRFTEQKDQETIIKSLNLFPNNVYLLLVWIRRSRRAIAS